MRRLILRPGGIGDCLLAFPAMEQLRADQTEVWVPGALTPLVRFADQVRSLVSTGIDTLGLPCRQPDASLVEHLRGFDAIVSWYGANRETFRTALDRLRVQVEFHAALPPPDWTRHATEFFAQQLGLEARAPRLQFATPPQEYIACHPFSGGRDKNWPASRFRALAEFFPLEYCVSPEQSWAGAHQFASLADVARWLAGARAYVGNDSGITHLAAAVGVPVVALFGPSDPRVWKPLAPRTRLLRAHALDDLPVDAVRRALDDLLDRQSPDHRPCLHWEEPE
jgi:ADP-heptose:LPS heptosyltransferase